MGLLDTLEGPSDVLVTDVSLPATTASDAGVGVYDSVVPATDGDDLKYDCLRFLFAQDVESW